MKSDFLVKLRKVRAQVKSIFKLLDEKPINTVSDSTSKENRNNLEELINRPVKICSPREYSMREECKIKSFLS